VEQPSKSQTSKLEARFATSALKYFQSLDKTTQRRIKDKIAELEIDPQNIRTSKPLKGAQERSARVGSFRILFDRKQYSAGFRYRPSRTSLPQSVRM
jgi:mRNA-degrading endonuclease RelE of RelBE toxin-antitoxin system